MQVKSKFSVLMRLRSINHGEFRNQIIARLKKISGEKNYREFVELLDRFKKEFINDSYFYIDSLNTNLRNFLLLDKLDFRRLQSQFLFLTQIGDTYTYELLRKVVEHLKDHQKEMEELQIALFGLEERLRKYEEDSDEFKLYPMIEIIDQWSE